MERRDGHAADFKTIQSKIGGARLTFRKRETGHYPKSPPRRQAFPELMKSPDSLVLAFGPFFVDPHRRTLTHARDGVLPLTPKQFDTLLFLAERAGEVLDKDTLLAQVWAGTVVEENNLSQAISQLRKVLGDDGETHRYILTVPRKGYRFVANVARVSDIPLALQEPSVAVPAPAEAAPPAPQTAPTPPIAIDPPKPKRRFPSRIHLAIGAIVLLAAGALGLALKNSAGGGEAAPGAEKSVAVLPFANLSGDKDDEYFSAGMTEDMLTQLAQVSGLRVVSHSAPGEKIKADRELAKKLGVEHLLQGAVRRGDNRFRISAQLIDAETGKHLWAKSYDRDIKDVLATQSEVATEIAHALRAVLLKSEKEALARHARGNVELHLLYRQGIQMLAQGRSRTPDDFMRTKAQFERILDLDANSALGHAGLAAYHLRTPAYGMANMEESLRAAKRHTDRALELDPKSSEGWLLRGLIESEREWNWKASEAAFKKSIELNPANAYAWRNYAHRSLLPAGRIDEALAAAQRAFAADPLNAYISHGLSIILGFMGRCDEAIARSKINIENNPGYLLDNVVVGRCHERQGRFKEATATFAKLELGWFPEEARRDIDAATERLGERGYWDARVKWAKAWAAKNPDGHYFVAAYQAQVGRIGEAFTSLDRALDERDIYLYTLRVDPYFEGIRGDPRFAALLKRMKLE